MWKQEAIFTFKMTTYTKIFLKFPQKFWENTQFFLYADPYQRGYYPQWQSLSEVGFLPGSNITFVTVVTDQAYVVEAQSFDQTLKEIMIVLKSMYGDDIPEPDHFYYYRWTQDPLYRGSYSNWPTGTSRCQHNNLQRPLGRLHFTGEAYSYEYYGFTQGAYIEGLKTGEKVANCLLKNKCKTNYRNYECTKK
jgi:polyamine oxidase